MTHQKVKAAINEAAKAGHAEGKAEQKKADTDVISSEIEALTKQRKEQMKGIICNKTIPMKRRRLN